MNKLHQAYISSFLGREHMSPAFFEAIEDLYNRPEVQGLSIYEQHLDIDRLQHITSVAYISFLTCRRLGLDYRTAARGAILHDLLRLAGEGFEPSPARLSASRICTEKRPRTNHAEQNGRGYHHQAYVALDHPPAALPGILHRKHGG